MPRIDLSLAIDPAIIASGRIDRTTTKAQLPKPTNPVATLSPSGNECREEGQLAVGTSTVSNVDVYVADPFNNVSIENGRCVGRFWSNEYRITNATTGIDIFEFGEGSDSFFGARVSSKRATDGRFDYETYDTAFDRNAASVNVSSVERNVPTERFPREATRLPVVPGVGRLDGSEDIATLLRGARKLPMNNASVLALKRKLGDMPKTVIGDSTATSGRLVDAYDLNGDGKVDAYRLSFDLGGAAVQVVDVNEGATTTYRTFGFPGSAPLGWQRAARDSRTGLLSPLSAKIAAGEVWSVYDAGKISYAKASVEAGQQRTVEYDKAAGTITRSTKELQ